MPAGKRWRFGSGNGEYIGLSSTKGAVLIQTQESSENRPSSTSTHQKEVEIGGQESIWSVAFPVDGKHIVGGSIRGTIRRWLVENGKEVGTPIRMNARDIVWNIVVSHDGKWIVSGTQSGFVQVWNAETHEKAIVFQGHNGWVRAVDVSPDSTKIASGSHDKTSYVWSLLTGKRLLGPLEHDYIVSVVQFSPDGRLIATAANSVRIYDSQNARLLVDVPIYVTLSSNQSLAWSRNSQQLFALSFGKISCLDVFTGTTLSQWSIHGNDSKSIALASNGTFIAASAGSSISFWDTTTHKQIGTIDHTAKVYFMAISENYDIVVGGGKKTILRTLCDILPPFYVSTSASRTWFANFLNCHRFRPSREFGKQRRKGLKSSQLVSHVCQITLRFICVLAWFPDIHVHQTK